ncbi:MAG: TRAP transporter small permease subunit [Pseudomonadota bacterium]
MATLTVFAAKVQAGFQRLEEGFLCLLLVFMIVLACLQIALRGLFSGGLLWLDPLLRHMVLWSGLFGAAVATGKGKHIALDVASYLIPAPLAPWLRLVIHLFSAVVSVALTWAAIIFVGNEMEFGGTSLLSVPSWIWNLVFPLAFTLIGLRFFAAAVSDAMGIIGRNAARGNEPR